MFEILFKDTVYLYPPEYSLYEVATRLVKNKYPKIDKLLFKVDYFSLKEVNILFDPKLFKCYVKQYRTQARYYSILLDNLVTIIREKSYHEDNDYTIYYWIRLHNLNVNSSFIGYIKLKYNTDFTSKERKILVKFLKDLIERFLSANE